MRDLVLELRLSTSTPAPSVGWGQSPASPSHLSMHVLLLKGVLPDQTQARLLTLYGRFSVMEPKQEGLSQSGHWQVSHPPQAQAFKCPAQSPSLCPCSRLSLGPHSKSPPAPPFFSPDL